MIQQCSDVNPFDDGTLLDALRGLSCFEEALSRLLYLAENGRPCGIVRGPEGTGKTPLLQCALRELRRGGQECGFLDVRRSSTAEFAWQIACELGTAPSSADGRRDWRLVEDAVQGRALAGRTTILVLDHLDEQDATFHPQWERLLAIAEASAGWCTVLGAARDDSAMIDQLTRRHAALRIDLAPLTLEETGDLLSQVVAISACRPFSDEAVKMLHDRSGGVLRTLTELGRLSILAQSAESSLRVTEETIELVAAEVVLPPQGRKLIPEAAVTATIE